MKYKCVECGSRMKKVGGDVLICPKCRHSVDVEDYGHEEEWWSIFGKGPDESDKPEFCEICGGPYPLCSGGCSIIDD